MPVSVDQIQKGTRVKSLNFGWMEVVSDPYPSGLSRNDFKVDVKFDNTGHVRKGVIDRYFVGGYVRDGSVEIPKCAGQVYNTFECGPAQIVDFVSTKELYVKFFNTGNVQEVQLDALVKGVVSDNLLSEWNMFVQSEAAHLNILKIEIWRAQKQHRESLKKQERATALAEAQRKREFAAEQQRLREDALKQRKSAKIANLEKVLEIGVKELDQETESKGVLNIDFKDRDGNWVLRFSLNGVFIQTRLGKLHNNITQRTNNAGSYSSFNAAYSGVQISDLFKDPQKFCDWAVSQPGWGLGYQIEKDLLSGAQKIYSESTCLFLPREINAAIIPAKKTCIHFSERDNYNLHFSLGGEEIIVPGFETKDEALDAYRKYREAYVKKLAYEYRPAISEKAFQALLNWKLIIPDC